MIQFDRGAALRLTDARAPALAILIALLAGGCTTRPDMAAPPPTPAAALLAVNAAVNLQGRRCPHDYCLKGWPKATELDRLDYWDCKAYAVAKADRLIHGYGYAPARLEYLLIAGAPLRVTHAALLVDGRWVMDLGLRCQVCELEQFAADLKIIGRLPVTDLPLVMDALRH